MAAPVYGQTSKLYQWCRAEARAARLAESGMYDEASALLRQALADRKQAFTERDPGQSSLLVSLAYVLCRQEHFSEAEELLRQAKDLLESAYYAEHALLAPVVEGLADLYLQQGRREDAEPLLKQLVDIRNKTCRGDHADVLHAQIKLARHYMSMRKFSEAESLFTKAASQAKACPWGPVADYLYGLALALQAQDKFEAAESNYRQAIKTYKQRKELQSLRNCLCDFSGMLQKSGRSNEASATAKEAQCLRQT